VLQKLQYLITIHEATVKIVQFLLLAVLECNIRFACGLFIFKADLIPINILIIASAEHYSDCIDN
jgi:hypothetical protein